MSPWIAPNQQSRIRQHRPSNGPRRRSTGRRTGRQMMSIRSSRPYRQLLPPSRQRRLLQMPPRPYRNKCQAVLALMSCDLALGNRRRRLCPRPHCSRRRVCLISRPMCHRRPAPSPSLRHRLSPQAAETHLPLTWLLVGANLVRQVPTRHRRGTHRRGPAREARCDQAEAFASPHRNQILAWSAHRQVNSCTRAGTAPYIPR